MEYRSRLLNELKATHIVTPADEKIANELEQMVAHVLAGNSKEGYALTITGKSGAGKSESLILEIVDLDERRSTIKLSMRVAVDEVRDAWNSRDDKPDRPPFGVGQRLDTVAEMHVFHACRRIQDVLELVQHENSGLHDLHSLDQSAPVFIGIAGERDFVATAADQYLAQRL